MLDKKATDYIIKSIKDLKNSIRHSFFNHYMNEGMNNGYIDDGTFTYPVINGMKQLYYNILVYLEVKQLLEYRRMFEESFSSRIKDSNEILKSTQLYPEGDEELILLDEFEDCLRPFYDFDYRFEEITSTHDTRLKELLKSTKAITIKSKVDIKGEASIYKEVLWALKLYFPSTRLKNHARFISSFKAYNPDILIPELETAVEYKYIRDVGNIDEYIDQVRIDSINYKGDVEYKKFYAVLCIKDISTTEESIRIAWDEKKFPKNWELIVVSM